MRADEIPKTRRSRRPAASSGGAARRQSSRVVHRPRYDDWSLPKGKLDPGESWEDGALREVEEETGLRCRLGDGALADHLPRPQGPLEGRPLLADGARGDGEFEPNDEVDELRWLPAADGRPSCSATSTTASWPREARPVNRDRFPGLRDGWARLDGPAGTQMVDSAIEAMADWMRSGRNANHGGAVRRRRTRTDELRRVDARAACATLLGGDPQGVVFGAEHDRADDALRRRRRRARSRPGDEIVCTRLDHDANVRPWVIAAERAGATVRFAEPEPDTLELPATRGRGGARPSARAGSRSPPRPTRSARVPDLPGIVAAAHARRRARLRRRRPRRAAPPARRRRARLRRARLLGLQVVRPARRRSCAARPELLEELHARQARARRPTRSPDRWELGHAAVRVARRRRARRPSTCSSSTGTPSARTSSALLRRRARRPRRDRRRDALRRRRATARRR